jgi:amino acid adenylation domain-containing protein
MIAPNQTPPLVSASLIRDEPGVDEVGCQRHQLDELDVNFWKAHLSGAPALLELPSDRARPAAQSYAGGSVGVALPPELTVGLRGLSQRYGVTLFMTLLAGWSALLCRLSGQSDLVIGTPVANRPRSELESLIGFFVNTLALRVRLEDDPSVAGLLAQIKASMLAAYAHQDIPFAQVVEALQPPRSLSYNPIFQVMLAFDNAPGERALSLPGLKVSEFEQTQNTAQFDLTLSLRDAGERIEGSLVYATDLFDRSSIERMSAHLLSLLEAMVADDQQRISELNLLSPTERQQLLVGFNDTHRPYPSEQCIHELFEEQVARTPDAVAVVFEERQLSYGELNAHANRLAHHLIALGIRPDDRVAICMERSLEMVVGLLGIMKAGGAYVPLDPSYPAQRLAYMLEDSAPVALLTQAAVRGGLPALEVPVVVLDLQDPASMMAREPKHNPDASALGLTSSNLAYVIYTSGSTGLPKGVMVEQRSVVNFLSAMARAPGLSVHDVLLAVTTLSFDIAGLELYLPLISGARLVLASRESVVDAEALSQLINQHAVTIMQATPATWRLLLSYGWQGRADLRVLCGGEALPTELSARLAAQVGTLWNLYGPTETTIWSTMARINGLHTTAIASIGRPIANTQIYILDPRGQPVPIGVRGEIHIGGVGVARGYLNRAELSAQRFVPDEFSPEQTARMYQTGDLGRWLPDGNIEYLGRNDFQVKIRGFRIELGEIEARLTACDGVRQAVVVAREDSSGDKRLVAYLTVQQGVELSAAQLRSQLSMVLPEYMVPSGFVTLQTLPLTANGKLDRKALPAPDHSSVVSAEYQAPVGEVETAIARIWQTVLGLPRIGRHDNFFELGGYSLLVLKAMAAIKAEFGRPIVMAWAFQAPTPAQLAALVSHDRTNFAWKHLVALNEGGSRRPLFCLNGFDGDVHDYLHIARFLDPSVPVYGLQVASAAEDANIHELLDTRMEAYEQEIRSVQPRGPYRLCGFSFGGSEAFDLARLLEDAGEEVVLILLDAYRPSRWLAVLSWFPRMASMVQAHAVISTAKRKLQNLLTYDVHRWRTGEDKDLRHALFRRARNRKYKPFSGQVILFQSQGFEEWAFQLQLDGHNGWKKYVTGPFKLIPVQAGHSALMKEPTVKSVVGHLNAILCD